MTDETGFDWPPEKRAEAGNTHWNNRLNNMSHRLYKWLNDIFEAGAIETLAQGNEPLFPHDFKVVLLDPSGAEIKSVSARQWTGRGRRDSENNPLGSRMSAEDRDKWTRARVHEFLSEHGQMP